MNNKFIRAEKVEMTMESDTILKNEISSKTSISSFLKNQ